MMLRSVRNFAIKSFAVALLTTPAASLRAGAQIAVLGNTVEEHTASLGESYEGTIVIRNATALAQPVRVYQTDYLFHADGTSAFATPGSTSRSNARWITPSTGSLVLPPSGELTISYVVKVPNVQTLGGTYWSSIMVEAAPTAAPAASRGKVGLSAVLRYAVQISTQIRETGKRSVNFTNQRFVADKDGAQSLVVDVVNNGERAYHPLLWVELYDASGVLKNRVKQQRGLLYPETSLRQTFTLGALPHGTYKALVFADIGEDAISAGQYQLKF
jgi:hypothetical protein